MDKSELNVLKFAFYDWCESLSLDETASNATLLAGIERFERMLIALAA